MHLLLFLTKRFLKSKKESKLISSVSKITITGIAIGIAVVIMALTILDGFEKVVAEKISEFNSQIKVTGFGNRNLPQPKYVAIKVKETFGEEITSIDPFASKLAIIKSRKFTDGINVTGITGAFSKSSFQKFRIDGSCMLDETHPENIIVGKVLAQRMRVKINDRITLFCLKGNKPPSMENPPAIEQFIVAGIFETGISEYDDGNAFIDLKKSQELFAMDGFVSGFNIGIKNSSNASRLSDELQEYLGYPFYVRTIIQVHQNIFTWIELQKKPIPIVLGLIIIVAVFNIVGTMLMIVLEKTNSIGVLRSLGMNRKTILLSFMANSGYLIFWGLLIGNLLAFVLSVLQKEFDLISLPDKVYFVTSVPISIDLNSYLIVSGITICVAFLSSIIPAFIATKINPITALRFD
jgi:lipoprotein-releasing system permease protein